MTDERFQQLIQEIKAKAKKKEEKEKQQKAILREKKRKARGKAKREEKSQQKAKETQFQTFYIYNDKYIERETAITDLYLSREELQEAEKRGEGKLNWRLLDKLIEETKKMLENEIYLCKD